MPIFAPALDAAIAHIYAIAVTLLPIVKVSMPMFRHDAYAMMLRRRRAAIVAAIAR